MPFYPPFFDSFFCGNSVHYIFPRCVLFVAEIQKKYDFLADFPENTIAWGCDLKRTKI
ncbi:hypothetical protein SAMN05444414_1284 [Roseovarius marisflavi]|uniref:Uncharacterized protein n=1 Tax=Roseovarius marisflavi TaxID=1054996 RepID=A0A1M7CNI0_9RHOB|nr:hypothetical protein SAMN05444414_1284 [Roseovarius marisflavi]